MAHDDNDTIRREFGEAVNMTPKELERWLETEESRSLMNWGHDPLKEG